MKKLTMTLTALGFATAALMTPMSAMAASRDHGQSQKSQWQSIAAGSAVVGILGLLGHNSTIAGAGLLGAAYSEYRADSDRDRGYDRDRDRDDYSRSRDYDDRNNDSYRSGDNRNQSRRDNRSQSKSNGRDQSSGHRR